MVSDEIWSIKTYYFHLKYNAKQKKKKKKKKKKVFSSDVEMSVFFFYPNVTSFSQSVVTHH